MRYKHVLTTAAVAATVVVAGCSSNNATTTSGGGSSAAPTTASSSPSSQQTFNKADVTFAQQMIPHHRQAVEMAKLATTRAKDPKVKELATKIEAAQGPEIQIMTGWLTSWGQKVPEDMTGMAGMDHGGMMMPGMMSAADMEKLMNSSGGGFDRMFLTGMITHHKGAIEMAKTEQADGKNPDAVALAKKIEADQTAEVATMQGLLSA